MAIGPVQLLVLGFPRPDLHGEVEVRQLTNLAAAETAFDGPVAVGAPVAGSAGPRAARTTEAGIHADRR